MASRSLPPITRPLALVMSPAHAERMGSLGAAVLRAFRSLLGLPDNRRLLRLTPPLVMHVAHSARLGDAWAAILRALRRLRPVDIGLLLSGCRPSDIAGFVVAIAIRVPVKRVAVNPALPAGNVLLWPWSDLGFNVGDEPGQIVPLRADGDPPAAVPGVVRGGGVLAAAQHLMPDAEKGMFVPSGGEPVPSGSRPPLSFLLGRQAAGQASRACPSFGCSGRHLPRRVVALQAARLLMTVNQCGNLGDRRVAAFAPAYSRTPSLRLRWRNSGPGVGVYDDETSEPLPYFNEDFRLRTTGGTHRPSMPAVGAANQRMVA